MKVKKELIDSFFGKKQSYTLDYVNEQELENCIYVLMAEFKKQWVYIKLHKNDKTNIALLSDTRIIDNGNFLLFEYESCSFLEKIIKAENLSKTRDINIYFFDKAIEAADDRIIKKILFNAPFEIVLGNYLETTKFTIDAKLYNSNFADIIEKLKKV